jgi:hypothetical protein
MSRCILGMYLYILLWFSWHTLCAKCTHKLFLSRAAVLCHFTASKPCFTSKLGFREIQVDVRTSDVMAGAQRPRRDQRRTSDTSQKVPQVASVIHMINIPCTKNSHHQRVYPHSVVVLISSLACKRSMSIYTFCVFAYVLGCTGTYMAHLCTYFSVFLCFWYIQVQLTYHTFVTGRTHYVKCYRTTFVFSAIFEYTHVRTTVQDQEEFGFWKQ